MSSKRLFDRSPRSSRTKQLKDELYTRIACADESSLIQELQSMIHWCLVANNEYEGNNPTLQGATFNIWKFYSPKGVARIKELEKEGQREVNRAVNGWLETVDAPASCEAMQYSHTEDDYIFITIMEF